MSTLRSLGRRTDLIFARFAGEVTEHRDYVVVRTPSNPTYHWGNFVIFRSPPATGDYAEWSRVFETEIGKPETGTQHRLFAWDIDDENPTGDHAEFLEEGLRLDSGVVLTTDSVGPPPHPNDAIEIRTIETDAEWRLVIDCQVESRSPEYDEAGFRVFKEAQFRDYRRMAEAGLGSWYGAFVGDQLAGNLGLFHERGVARYQIVVTHPDFRRRGICGTLVCAAAETLQSQRAVEGESIEQFVMEADPDYHAARIYESVGFQATEHNYALYWHREMPST